MNSRGSVLIGVIWMVSLLSIFTVVVGHRASQELLFAKWVQDKTYLRALAKAGIERASYAIQEDEFLTFDAMGEPWAMDQDAFYDRKMGQGLFFVVCDPDPIESTAATPLLERDGVLYGACDESARLNLNTANEQQLRNLVQTTHPDLKEKFVIQIAQSIVDWRDEDDQAMPQGAEAYYYKSLPNPYAPANQDFQSVEELQMVQGVTPEVYKKIKDYLTVYTEGPVNFNTAGSVVLQALGLSANLVEKVISFRRGEDEILGTEDDAVFQHVEGISAGLSASVSFSPEDFSQVSNAISQQAVGVRSDSFRIHSIGRLMRGDQETDGMITCVVTRDGSILYWHEGI